MSEILQKAQSILNSSGRDYAESPLPAWVLSTAGTPLHYTIRYVSHSLVLSQLHFSRKYHARKIFPRPWTLFLFSSTLAVGGWMTYDHAPIDGAGTTAAWSIMYLMVNGVRKSIKPLIHMRNPVPLGVASLAAVNAVTYGSYYLNTSRPKEE